MSTNDPLPQLPPLPAPEGTPHIYVINSDEAFLEMIADLLDDVRAHVTLEQMRPNPAVTVSNLRSARPDLLILDVVPGRNEPEMLLDMLAEEDDLDRLPVLLASTSAGLAERLASEHDNLVRDVLAKPFNLDDFYARLNKLIGVTVP